MLIIFSFCLQIFTQTALAEYDNNSVYSLKLNRGDSASFAYFIQAFNGPKIIADPEQPDVTYKKYWYESDNAALTIGCVHTIAKEKELYVECSFDFAPSRSTSQAEVLTLPQGVLRATISDSGVASKLHMLLDQSPYTSNEWVRVFVADRPQDHPRVRLSCEPTAIRAITARKCVMDVVLN
jgi:hypothetical protein